MANLHDNNMAFEQLITETAKHFKIQEKIVAQDYFVYRLLKTIESSIPEIVFKGGTSLSKCHGCIKRFSEDIDLAWEQNLTQAPLKKLNKQILECISKEWQIQNENEFLSGKKMHTYQVVVPSKQILASSIKVETFFAIPAFPVEQKQVGNYIYDYLVYIKREDLAQEFELLPFEINTQTKARTFADKIFAVCDYYLSDDSQRNSRHLYDLHNLLPTIEINDQFLVFMREIALLRQKANPKINLSSAEHFLLSNTLDEIIKTGFYEADYNNVTKKLLFDTVSYEDCVKTIKTISKQLKNY